MRYFNPTWSCITHFTILHDLICSTLKWFSFNKRPHLCLDPGFNRADLKNAMIYGVINQFNHQQSNRAADKFLTKLTQTGKRGRNHHFSWRICHVFHNVHLVPALLLKCHEPTCVWPLSNKRKAKNKISPVRKQKPSLDKRYDANALAGAFLILFTDNPV